MTPLFHPFYFSFAFGSTLLVSLTGFLIDFFSLHVFGYNRTTAYLFTMDAMLIVISICVRIVPMTSLFWLLFSIFYSFYLTIYSIYLSIRSYHFLERKRSLSFFVIGNIFMYICFLVFVLGIVGFLPIYTWVFATMIPFPFAIAVFFLIKLEKVIKGNPMYLLNLKQKHLIRIVELIVIFEFILAIPCISLIIISGFIQNATILDIALIAIPIIKLTISVGFFSEQINKSLQDNKFEPTGTSIFRTQLTTLK